MSHIDSSMRPRMQSLHRAVRRVALAAAALGVAMTLPTGVAAAQSNGLVGAWSFDEASGNTFADVSGARNNGTAANITRTTGKNGGALSFNGSTARWSPLRTPLPLDLSSALTMEAWVKPSTLCRLVADPSSSRNSPPTSRTPCHAR